MMIVISSGHGLYVRGAVGPEPWGLDEVDEARRVVAEVAQRLSDAGNEVEQLHDNVSHNQSDNLHWIVSHHNAFPAADRLDVSVHFNAYLETTGGRGVEVCYISQKDLAARVSSAIANAGGLINRGAKYRSDLYFLNGTTGSRGAILIETCFVDAQADVTAYDEHWDDIMEAITDAIAPVEEAPPEFHAVGKCSWFGGPQDEGVSASEQLAWWSSTQAGREQAPELFLSVQPPGTTGAARALNPESSYIAMRFDYQNQWSKSELASGNVMFWVWNKKTGRREKARPSDWGPHTDTNRLCDLSPGLMARLELETDDEVEITLA
jgi:N-acetylmuramoyl-L-alanine amidase